VHLGLLQRIEIRES